MSYPKIGFVGTGGTIAFVGSSPLDIIEYTDTKHILGLEALIKEVPSLAEICIPIPYSLVAVDSIEMAPKHWLTLRDTVTRLLREDIAGVVVTHGTATLEETSYFLDLVIDDDRPVVVTGAMRPISALSTDAHLNIINACRIASAEASRGLGTLVGMSGLIHAARYVTKLNTYSVEAFGAANGGAVGEVVGPNVHYFSRPSRAPTLTPVATLLPRVDIVMSYAGSDGFAIDAAVERQAQAIVVAGFAPGNVTPADLEAMRRARSRGVQIIQASRTMRGQTLNRSDLKRERFIAAGGLTPQKARVLAMVAIASGLDADELQQTFEDAA